jgi:hypothetical protein
VTTVAPTRHPWRFLLEVVILLGTWRFLTGRRLVGPHLTNATFWLPGTRAVGEGKQRVKVGRWHYLPGYERALIRWLVVAAAVGALLHHWLVVAYAAGFTLWAVWSSVRAVRTWRHDRTYVRPLHVALKALLGLPETITPDEYLFVPRGVPATGRPMLARVVLPETFNATKDARQLVSGLVLDKLGLASADVDLEYRTVGRPTLIATRAAKPPAAVLLEDVAADIDKLGPSEVLLGSSAHGLVTFDLETESPHAGFSCESGTGKSEQLGAIVAQFIRKSPDNRAVVIDPKMVSLEALQGVPGVTIVNDPLGDEGVLEMWAAIDGVRAEVMRRAGVLKADPSAEFDALLLVVDEANVLAALSGATWERVKPKGDKGKAPLWADLLVILAAGRRFRVHVILVGQDLRESALGGIGLRTMLGLRGIAGYDAQGWMRFMQSRPIPTRQPGRGRWCYRIGGRDVWVQNVWGGPDPGALAAFAQGRVSHVPSPDVSAGGRVDTPAGGTPIVGLEAAAAWLEVSVPAFRKARQRRPIPGETREHGRPAWNAETLRAWRAGDLPLDPSAPTGAEVSTTTGA